jgi:formylglycine-generating enzyme required for sulfatase activity
MIRWSILPLALLAARAFASPPPATTSLDLGGGEAMEFVLVPAGTFTMGSAPDEGEEDESPQRRVTLSRPFYLGKFEVTQAQWERVMGVNPSEFKGASRPVENVSWDDCQRFLARVSARTGRKLALPTEAQWEYACRAGTASRWSFGNDPAAAGAHAWLEENSGGATHPVGQKRPNAWGVHDMLGNVSEWCADFYAKHAYAGGAATDPAGPPRSEGHIVRGGGWGEHRENARSAIRNCLGADGAHNGIGFRCLLAVESDSTGDRAVAPR